MSEYAESLWKRAQEALRTAKHDVSLSYNAAASRAYYAAFYAVSALFESEGQSFSKHTAVRAAVHRDLVNTGRWDVARGEDYSMLMAARQIADYGGMRTTTREEAEIAIAAAERILKAVGEEHPELPTR